jgi:ribosomal protein S18 acetylase RimI-like enzyme
MAITIEESNDIDVIAALSAAVQNEHHDRRPDWFKPYDHSATRDALWGIADDPDARCLVAYVDDAPVGYALLVQHDRPESEIRYADRTLGVDQMSVDAEYRRQGIASALVERVREIARAERFNRIRLTVWSDNEAARALYTASGFTTFRDMMELAP